MARYSGSISHHRFKIQSYIAVAVALALTIAACTSSRTEQPAKRQSQIISGVLYVAPYKAALNQEDEWKREGRVDDAKLLEKITSQPIATWITGDPKSVRQQVTDITEKASVVGKLPILVAYNIPGRDCGAASAGGAPSLNDYKLWIQEYSAGLGSRRALIILEPDAIADSLGRCAVVAKDRYQALSYAISLLKRDSNAHVYLDAGNPLWIDNLSKLAQALKASNIEHADGFSLNVSNFVSTEQNISYGIRLAGMLGNAHFVIDTARNGRGTATNNYWCNPPGRALGHAPTNNTGLPLVDAYLWIKRPGESDGDCGRGEPQPGKWWADYALQLAKNG